MRRIWLCVLFALPLAGLCLATVFGTVHGIVHDPQHRPVSGVQVILKAKASEFTLSARTDDAGQFHFDAVPLGEYTVAISDANFVADQQSLAVLSGTSPILHFELRLPTQSETVLVSADAAQTETVTPTTLVDRLQIQETPGAARTNSLAMITNYVPGAYYTHDQLHVRGGHQVSWLIDGVSIPNTNIASNLGPQIDPKDIDSLETQRGSYSADYGDRTYGVFNVAPRTGFERNNEAELVFSTGNFYQTDDQLNFDGHTNRFAYYTSLSGNRTNLGLQTPTSAVQHDAANGFGGFTSLIFNLDPQDQLRLIAQARRDFYQVPTDPGNPTTILRDANRENDSFAAFSWVRTFSPGLVLTISPYFHYNSANYRSDSNDIPSAATQDRSSKYGGGQANVSWIKGRNNARMGLYSFAQQDDQFFHVVYNDGSGTVIPPLAQAPTGSLIAVFVEDQFKPTSWLALNAGLRQTHFSGTLAENATSPRVGASVRIPKLNWVFRGFYGHFYQAPPLGALSGPALNAIQNQQQLDFVPLQGERDEEHQFGVTIPFKGWVLDADNFLTRATNFFDHNSLNNSNVFFPVDVQGARINGWELTLRSPRLRNRAQFYLTYSNQLALGRGCIVGGLIGACPVPPPGYFFLDHDQRNTLHLGGQYTLPWRAYASTDVYYASGFSNSNQNIPGDHLSPHTTFDLSLGKSFGERFSANFQAINVANRRVLLDNSFTFGGTHFLNPREIFMQLRYRFHY
jgi:outer membrane receptor protein involved in Fe transport